MSNSLEKFQVKWVHVQDKYGKCKRKPKTTLKYEIVSKPDRSFVSHPNGMNVKVKLDNCRNTAKEEVSVPEHTICKEELYDINAKGYDVVTE